MASRPSFYQTAVLPWTVSEDDERRFYRVLKRVLLVCALLALLMPWLPVPKEDRSRPEELPPRFAKLLLEHETPPPVAVVKPEPEIVKAPTPEVTKPEPNKPPVTEARKPEPKKPPGEKMEAARRKASGAGLLGDNKLFEDLRGAPVATQLQKDVKPGLGVGTSTGPGVGAGKSPGLPDRNVVAKNATSTSGGIGNTAAYSRNTGGGGLAGRATTVVEGSVGGGGGGGPGGGGALRRGASGKVSRSLDEIRLVFDRNKGALYNLYNRALREDPTLQGKVVLTLTILPSGQVQDCRIVSSELHAPELERKLVARVKQFDFGSKDVDIMIVEHWGPLDFLPGG